jgi:hypothetical protein
MKARVAKHSQFRPIVVEVTIETAEEAEALIEAAESYVTAGWEGPPEVVREVVQELFEEVGEAVSEAESCTT